MARAQGATIVCCRCCIDMLSCWIQQVGLRFFTALAGRRRRPSYVHLALHVCVNAGLEERIGDSILFVKMSEIEQEVHTDGGAPEEKRGSEDAFALDIDSGSEDSENAYENSHVTLIEEDTMDTYSSFWDEFLGWYSQARTRVKNAELARWPEMGDENAYAQLLPEHFALFFKVQGMPKKEGGLGWQAPTITQKKGALSSLMNTYVGSDASWNEKHKTGNPLKSRQVRERLALNRKHMTAAGEVTDNSKRELYVEEVERFYSHVWGSFSCNKYFLFLLYNL